jgi:hypothetical protein
MMSSDPGARLLRQIDSVRGEAPLSEWRRAWLTAYPSMLTLLLDGLVAPWLSRMDGGESAWEIASDPRVSIQDVSNLTRLVKLERSIRDALEREA